MRRTLHFNFQISAPWQGMNANRAEDRAQEGSCLEVRLFVGAQSKAPTIAALVASP